MKKIYSLRKTRLTAILLIAAIFSFNANAKVVPVANDSVDIIFGVLDTINGGSFAWASGDTLLLTSSTMYTVTKTSYIYQDVTIMGDPSLTVQPSIYFADQGFNFKEDSIYLAVKGFKAIGWDPVDSSSQGNFFIRCDQTSEYDGSWFPYVIAEDIECVGFKSFLQLDKSKASVYDSVIVNNCVIHDATNNYNMFDFSQNKINLARITNNTIYNAPRGIIGEFWAADTAATSTDVPFNKTIIIDHNTIYNVVNGASFVAIHNIKDGTMDMTISNNIISTLSENTNSRPFRYEKAAGSIDLKNNVFHNFVSSRYNAGSYYNIDQDSIDKYYPGLVTQINTDTANPYFADPMMGSFMLPDTSSLIKAATDGGAIGDPRWVPVAGVSINPLSVALVEKRNAQLTAVVNVSGTDKTVTWSVTNGTGTATINETSGLLSALTAGSIKVFAVSNYSSVFIDSLSVTIEPEILVTSLTLTAKNSGDFVSDSIISGGGYLLITATAAPGDVSYNTVTWTVDDPSIASIISFSATVGKLIAINCGTVAATATAADGSGIKGTFTARIFNQVSADSIIVSGENASTTITTLGGTLQMEAIVLPDSTCIKDVKWSVNDTLIATIDEVTGLLTAVGNGVIAVTAKATDDSYTKGVKEITISGQTSSIFGASVSNIKVVPNPASKFIQISTDVAADVVIHNLVGAVVISTSVEPNTKIDISELKAGIYIASIKAGNKLATTKFIKE